jgi:hypothetical protein
MDKIIVEDRSTETPEQKLEREVFAAGQLIVGFTIHVCGPRPPVGLGALAYALGMGAARTGASLDAVLASVKQHFDATKLAVSAEEEPEPATKGPLS